MDNRINPAVLQKYNGIHDTGMQALRNGNVTPYPGFDDPVEKEKLQRQIITAVIFTKKSVTEFDRRVACRIRALEEELGFTMIIADSHFSLHATVITGTPRGELPESEINEAVEELVGITIRIDWAIADGANILIAASDILKKITIARSKLADIYQNAGINPSNYDNILHCTVGRMTAKPPNRLLKFYRAVIVSLKIQLTKEPLELTVEKVLTTSTYELLTM